jgi:hypothetical protein
VPRRLAAPDLRDDVVRLEPLSRALAPQLGWLLEPDPDIAAFTYIPNVPDADWLERWLGRYEDGGGTASGPASPSATGAS